ncbi:MAG TPA: hypothetical protein VIV60_00690 [Polyangiaceae bacterium]
MIEADAVPPGLPNSGNVLRRFTRALRLVLVLVVAGFVLATLVRLARGFDAREVTWHWPALCLTALGLVATNLMQAMAWVRLLSRMSHRVLPARPILAGFMAGQLARYVPSGKIALLVVRTAAVAGLGLPHRLVASSIGLEVLSWVTVGMSMGSACLALSSRLAFSSNLAVLSQSWLSFWSLALVAASVFSIAMLLVVDRRRFPKWALRLINAEGEGPLLSLDVLGWQVASWFGPVIQGLLLPIAVGAAFSKAWPLTGVFLLAPIAGFLAVVAPGGLGVREAVLSFALAPELGASRALAVALLARVTFVVSEVIAWMLTKWISRRRPT